MTGIRRALAWTAVDRYLHLAIGIVQVAAMSRLLTPHEVGISAIGYSVLAMADTLRDFGATSYLIQRREVTTEALRTTFTLLLGTTLLLVGAIVFAAPFVAEAYGEPGLTGYIWVLATSFALGPFAGPILALMRRDMQFERLAAINLTISSLGAFVSITLAFLGFSYMSIAWAGVCMAVCGTLMAFWFRPSFHIYRLGFQEWRDVFYFGSFATLTAFLNKAYQAVPLFLLGRTVSIESVGLFQRATSICDLPDRFVTALIGQVALPAFSAAARAGADLKETYLKSIEHITAIHWPALSMLVVLAYPLVRIMLGPQWVAVAPLVQILAVASLSLFAAVLSYPVLVAVGRINDTLYSSLISLPLSLLILVPAAFLGLETLTLSFLLTLPLQMFVSLIFIRRHVHFSWLELAGATRKGALVTIISMIGPAAVVAINGAGFDMHFLSAIVASALGLMGWLGGLWLSGHPLLAQLGEIAQRANSALTARGFLRNRLGPAEKP